ncbi:hypothetical protein MRBLMI12_002873 [Microbacterium sp. LMI12-1-1.1]|uniref:PKD domain-containing protein n=1 Tax=unclassified Microbacterium TaxID=2609290 RepID=UPI0034139548
MLIRILAAEGDPAPSSTPGDPATGAVDVALSNYYLAIGLLLGAIVVIVLALVFAWLYHRDALRTIEKLATTPGAPPVAIDSGAAVERGIHVGPAIIGSNVAHKDTAVMFTVEDLADGATVSWDVQGATIEEIDGGRTILATFAEDGTYKVRATVTDAGGTETELEPKQVTIQPPVAASAPAPALVIPFVVKNWGRLVIVLFGVGVISALMATKILDAAAGVGILGTLLGAGAVSATTGGTADTPAQRPADTAGTPAGGDRR